jgi:hypothetical protein
MSTEELPFGEDFTRRVFIAADGISRRRRHMRRAAVAATVLLFAGAGTLGALRIVSPRISAMPAAPHLVAGYEAAAAYDTQTAPMDYMFPEADDLTQFSKTYTTTTDEGQVLFSDDTDTEDSGD